MSLSINSIGSTPSVYTSPSFSPFTPISSASPNDSLSISAFGPSVQLDEKSQNLNELYSKKATAESELNNIKGQVDDAQAQVNDRQEQITQEQKAGEAKDEQQQALEEQYNECQESYEKDSQAKSQAQQELTSLQQQSSAKDQAINTNAQQTQQVAADLTSAQSELSSLTPPTPPSGEDKDGSAQAQYQAELAQYEAKKSALENKISSLESQKQNLENTAQRLQSEKEQLSREQQTKEQEISQLDASMQAAQSQMDEIQQQMAEADEDLQQALESDDQLQEMQKNLEDVQQQQADKEAELQEIEAQIAEAEAKNENLQTARVEEAGGQFQKAAEEAGCDIAGSVASTQEAVAQEQYGKSFDELTEEEQLAIETKVDGEVTLAAMDKARQMLEDDPNNAAAQAVLEKGQKNLEAQENLAFCNFSNNLDTLPATMQDGATEAMSEAMRQAEAEGGDTEAAAMAALTQYVRDNADNGDLNDDEKNNLQELLGSADAYSETLQTTNKGQEIANAAAESLQKSDLALMKSQMAAELGVSADELIVLSGSGADDNINVTVNDNGKIEVNIDGETRTYTQDEAKYLLIDGGKGNDQIKVADKVEQNLHIYGGEGNDFIYGGGGDDTIYGSTGEDIITGGKGNDIVDGGEGKDTLQGGKGDDYIHGGEGEDTISGGDGSDIIDGGAGADIIDGGNDNDLIHGGEGNDDIKGGEGNDAISGGIGNDTIDAGYGDDRVYGGAGNDTIDGNDGKDYIEGGNGDDNINGGWGMDTIVGGAGKDDINGSFGEDNIYGDTSVDNIKDGMVVKDQINSGAEYELPDEEEAQDAVAYNVAKVTDKLSGSVSKVRKAQSEANKIKAAAADGSAGTEGSGDASGSAKTESGDGVKAENGDGSSAKTADGGDGVKAEGGDSSSAKTADGGSSKTEGGDVEAAPKNSKAPDALSNTTKGATGASELIMGAHQLRTGIEEGDVWTGIKGVGNLVEGVGDTTGLINNVTKSGDALSTLGKLNNGTAAFGGGVNVLTGSAEFIDGINRGDYGDAFSGAANVADGVKSSLDVAKAVKGTSTAAKAAGTGTKALTTASRVAGGVGGAFNTVAGGIEIAEGIHDGEKKQIATGSLTAAAGVATIVGCACPVAAPVAFGIAAVCSLVAIGIDIFG